MPSISAGISGTNGGSPSAKLVAIASVRHNQQHANNGRQDWTAVEAAASEAQALYAALANRALEADCLCNIAAARIYRGDTAAGLSAGRAARTISLEIDNAWGEVHSA